jgi:uncharacterized caspase-like protein
MPRFVPNIDSAIDGSIKVLDAWKKRRERKELAREVGQLAFDDPEVLELIRKKLAEKSA